MATGLLRASLIRFMPSIQSIRGDVADELVDNFGIECLVKGN